MTLLAKQNVWIVVSVVPALVGALCFTGACQTEIVAVGTGGAGGSGSVVEASATFGSATAIVSASFSSSFATTGTGIVGCTPGSSIGIDSMTTAASTGTSSPVECTLRSGNGVDNWEAKCVDGNCDCFNDGILMCSCIITAPNGCAIDCCPSPWANSAPFP